MNIPNLITTIRFILIPVFGYALYNGYIAESIALFFLGGLTDILDGYIARKFNMITAWGKLADPLADKLLQITALTILVHKKTVPIFILLVVIAKELLMVLGSVLLYKKARHVVSANWYGKAATVVFYLAVGIVIVWNLTMPLSGIIVGLAILPTIVALFLYYFLYYRNVRINSKEGT